MATKKTPRIPREKRKKTILTATQRTQIVEAVTEMQARTNSINWSQIERQTGFPRNVCKYTYNVKYRANNNIEAGKSPGRPLAEPKPKIDVNPSLIHFNAF